MLKIIHTADWHIGQTFYGFDRKAEHLFFFEWLKDQIKIIQPDVLLVAGDVFDSPNPSAESQKIYYRLLHQLVESNPTLQIIITAGNHDSAARLEAPNSLLEEMNIYIKGLVKRLPDGEIDYSNLLIPLKNEAWCVAVPYLRQGDYPNSESYAKGVQAMYARLYQQLEPLNKPIIVMGHLHASGAELSDKDHSERTVIGGLEHIAADTFMSSNIVYTALGHIHKDQAVGGQQNIRYAGSPLPMSFTEKKYKQGVNLIEISDGKASIERLIFEPLAKLLSIPSEPKLLKEVLDELQKLPDGEILPSSPYIEVNVLITEPEPSMRHKIEEVLRSKSVRLTRLASSTQITESQSKTMTYDELKSIDPLQMAEDVFVRNYNTEMPDILKALLRKVIEEAEQ